MRIAIPVWDGRVSPVFDVAKKIRVVEVDIERGDVVADSTHVLRAGKPASTLSELGIDVLICSAISAPEEATLWVFGVEVISDICGCAENIVTAFISGDTALTDFRAPGGTRRQSSDSKPPSPRRLNSRVTR